MKNHKTKISSIMDLMDEPLSLDFGVIQGWNGLTKSPSYESQHFQDEISIYTENKDDFTDFNIQLFIEEINETDSDCSSEKLKTSSGGSSDTDILQCSEFKIQNRPNTNGYISQSLNRHKCHWSDFLSFGTMNSELTNLILEISQDVKNQQNSFLHSSEDFKIVCSNRIPYTWCQNQLNTQNGSNRKGYFLSHFRRDNFTEFDIASSEAMSSGLRDFIYGISDNNTGQQNGWLCSSENPKSIINCTNAFTTGENKLKIQNSSRRRKCFLSSLNREISKECSISSLRAKSSLILQASTINKWQQSIDIIAPHDYENFSDIGAHTDLHGGQAGLSGTNSTTFAANMAMNKTPVGDLNIMNSDQKQPFLYDSEFLYNAGPSFLYQNFADLSYEGEISELNISKENISMNAIACSDESTPYNLATIEISRESELESTRAKSLMGYEQYDSRQRDKSNNTASSRPKYIATVPNRSAHSKDYFRLRTDPYLTAYRKRINHKQRLRVKKLNNGYKRLHAALPGNLAKQKLFKLEILQQAIQYIKLLVDILEKE